jgi:hypothetical protein
MRWMVWLGLAIAVALSMPAAGRAQGRAALVRELVEQMLRRAGKEAGEEGVEVLTRKLEGIAARHGDDAARVAAKVGPRGITALEEAGEYAPQAIRLMARHGDRAVWVIAKKNRLALFANLGDDAAESMLRHGQIAEPLLEAYGQPAAAALKTVSSRNARRLAMMANDGTLQQMGRTPELLEVIGRYGDRAADFVWRNKGALAVGTALAAFLANPEAFLSGTADLTRAVADSTVKPVASAAGQFALGVVRLFFWPLMAVVLVGMLLVVATRRYGVRWMGRQLWQRAVPLWSRLMRRRKTP